MNREQFLAKLRTFMTESGSTVPDVAEAAGVPAATINGWIHENKKIKGTPKDKVLALITGLPETCAPSCAEAPKPEPNLADEFLVEEDEVVHKTYRFGVAALRKLLNLPDDAEITVRREKDKQKIEQAAQADGDVPLPIFLDVVIYKQKASRADTPPVQS